MSLSWPETLDIELAPGGIALSRRYGLRRRTTQQTIALDNPDAGWQPILAALPDMLPNRTWGRAHVVLSSHWVRYTVLDPGDAVLGMEEMQAYAAARFQAIYGELAKGWHIVVKPAAPGRTSLACAVEADLLAALTTMLASRGLRPASVRPHLVAVHDRLRHRLPAGAHWLAVPEPGRLTAALLTAHSVRHVASTRLAGNDWAAALPGLLAREGRFAGCDPVPEDVRLSLPAGLPLPHLPGWRLAALGDGFRPGHAAP